MTTWKFICLPAHGATDLAHYFRPLKFRLTGKAKASGKYSHTVTITYFPSSKIKATITVTVKTAGGDAVNSASITVVPRK